MIVARVIRTFRDQGGRSTLQVHSLPWQALGRTIQTRSKVGATTDRPSTGVARCATHALQSAPCSRPSDTPSWAGSVAAHEWEPRFGLIPPWGRGQARLPSGRTGTDARGPGKER